VTVSTVRFAKLKRSQVWRNSVLLAEWIPEIPVRELDVPDAAIRLVEAMGIGVTYGARRSLADSSCHTYSNTRLIVSIVTTE
jgi:hypothetical protein